MRHIKTDFWPKPIPQRCFDWSAWYDGDEPNDDGQMERIGYGATMMEAVDDLLSEHPLPCEDCDGKGGILSGIECATCGGSGDMPRNDPLHPVKVVQ